MRNLSCLWHRSLCLYLICCAFLYYIKSRPISKLKPKGLGVGVSAFVACSSCGEQVCHYIVVHCLMRGVSSADFGVQKVRSSWMSMHTCKRQKKSSNGDVSFGSLRKNSQSHSPMKVGSSFACCEQCGKQLAKGWESMHTCKASDKAAFAAGKARGTSADAMTRTVAVDG